MAQMTLGEIAQTLGAEAEGDLSVVVSAVAEPQSATADQLALAMSPDFAPGLAKGAARVAVLWQGADWRALGLEGAIFAPRSRYVLAGVGQVFDHPLDLEAGIHPSSVIDPTAQLGEGASIGPFVHIGPRVRIGAGARIGSHVSIGADAVLGVDALLFPHASIGARVTIGDRFICQPGGRIGGDGFSFVSPSRDNIELAKATGKISDAARTPGFVRINSLAAVTIGDDVEIGANATVDRGTIADTRIGSGTKVDNLVAIGHNVIVGQHCLLCGQTGMAGSSRLGDRVVLGGKVGVADHVTVGSDVIIAGGSGVGRDVPSGQVMMGSPAMPRDEFRRLYMATRRLPALLERLSKSGKKAVSNPDAKR